MFFTYPWWNAPIPIFPKKNLEIINANRGANLSTYINNHAYLDIVATKLNSVICLRKPYQTLYYSFDDIYRNLKFSNNVYPF